MTITKLCQECARPMEVRRNKSTGTEFLGCAQWPECTYTEPLPIDVQMRRDGAATLPGFGAE